MATIIFKVLGTASHYRATYKLAQKLKLKSHRVIYIGEECFKESIISQGFEFYNNSLFHIIEDAPKGNIIKLILYSHQLIKEHKENYLEGLHLKEVVKILKPDLFILDVALSFFIPLLQEKNIKYTLFSTKGSLNSAYLIPPFTASFFLK